MYQCDPQGSKLICKFKSSSLGYATTRTRTFGTIRQAIRSTRKSNMITTNLTFFVRFFSFLFATTTLRYCYHILRASASSAGAGSSLLARFLLVGSLVVGGLASFDSLQKKKKAWKDKINSYSIYYIISRN